MDWDFLKNPISIDKISDNINLPKFIKKIVLERDEDYNLKGTLKFEDTTFFPKHNEVAGSFDEGFIIEGASDDNSIAYTLDSCHIRKVTFGVASGFAGTADLRFNKLNMKFSENCQTHLTEWYVNGPNNVLFGSTEGRILKYYTTKERYLLNLKLKDSTNKVLDHGSSIQLIWGKCEDFNFLIHTVSSLGPKWSTNVGIEYREDWGRIPKPHERVKIEELCSFVFGKHLLSVGYTTYDKDENIIDIHAQSPWGQDAKTLCSQPEYPPIRIHDWPIGDAEKIINYLLPKYMELSEPLCLTEALWNYWMSFDIPIGINLPIIVSAIETIIHPWYKWKKTKSHGMYLGKKEFVNLLQAEIELISIKLATKLDIIKKPEQMKYHETIINNILRGNEFTFTDRLLEFFKEIGLKVSKNEIEAIKERHLFVHGHAHFDEVDWEQVIRRGNSLHTIFNKILLQILEYKGDFIDRSIEGWNDAKLS
jgi:hypothetical protein